MADSLAKYMSERKCGEFQPIPLYVASGDYLSLYLVEDRCVAQRVDDLLTVYLSMESKDLVGCKIKGIKKILEQANSFGVHLDAGAIKLRFLFFLGAAFAKDETQRKRYYDLKDICTPEVLDRPLEFA